jgi:DNA replication and repair protein RecF
VILRQLTIERFRNLARVELDLSGGVTLFWGRNAQGKTNLLEAIHYLATGRSFRTRLDRECIPWGAEPSTVARIEGGVEGRHGRHELAVSLTDRAKYAWLDGKPVARLGDLLGTLRVVLFTPDDIALAGGGPAVRRRFLDVALSQMDPAYLAHLQSYSEAVRQRNAALRHQDSSLATPDGDDAIDPWAGPLVDHGVEISLARRASVRSLAGSLRGLYAEIAPTDGPLGLAYQSGSGIGPDADREQAAASFRARLRAVADAERTRGQTLVGPHRDELELTLDGREVRHFGSQGQQRSVSLALRLGEVRWMRERTGETPLLLVDDLGVELDRDRRARLLALFAAGAQTLATTASEPAPLGRMLGADRAIEVRDGALAKIKIPDEKAKNSIDST